MAMIEAGVPMERVAAMIERERNHYVQRNPKSKQLAEEASVNWHHGVPMHWMLDWSTPFPLFVADATGAKLTDVDGHNYDDFCLGDTGSMFGHSPTPVAAAIAEQARHGLTYMLPTEDVIAVGRLRPPPRMPTGSSSAGAAASPSATRFWSSTAATMDLATTPSSASKTARQFIGPA